MNSFLSLFSTSYTIIVLLLLTNCHSLYNDQEQFKNMHSVQADDKECILRRFKVNTGQCSVTPECNAIKCSTKDPIYGWNDEKFEFQFKCLNNGLIMHYHSISTPVEVNTSISELLSQKPSVAARLEFETFNKLTTFKYSRDYDLNTLDAVNNSKVNENSTSQNVYKANPFQFFASIDRSLDDICTHFYQYRKNRQIFINHETLNKLTSDNRITRFFPKTILKHIDLKSGESLLPKPSYNKVDSIEKDTIEVASKTVISREVADNSTNSLDNHQSIEHSKSIMPSLLAFDDVIKSPFFFPVAISIFVMIVLISVVFLTNILIYRQVRKSRNNKSMLNYI